MHKIEQASSISTRNDKPRQIFKKVMVRLVCVTIRKRNKFSFIKCTCTLYTNI